MKRLPDRTYFPYSRQTDTRREESLNEQLSLLVELQKVDDRIGGLQAEISLIPKHIKILRSDQRKEHKILEDLKAVLEAANKDRRTAERELEGYEDKIKKVKDQQFMIKNNKEYQTFLHELKLMEEKKGGLEDKVLTLMEQAAEVEKKIKVQEQAVGLSKDVFNDEERKLLDRMAVLETRLGAAQEEHATVIAKIENHHLRAYNRLKDFHKGKAVAGVIDGICQGCFLELRPQKYQEVKTNENLNTCDQCNRIIYFNQEATVEPQPDAGQEG